MVVICYTHPCKVYINNAVTFRSRDRPLIAFSTRFKSKSNSAKFKILTNIGLV